MIRVYMLQTTTMNHHNRPLHGFTLIELLVVVSIIAILIAMLLPALGAARDQTIRITCLSRLHAITLATVTYQLDNRQEMPHRPGSGQLNRVQDGGAGYDINKTFIEPYLDAPRDPTMFCPGPVYQVRNPSVHSAYVVESIGYQFYFRPAATWVVPKPDYRGPKAGQLPLWACISFQKPSDGKYFGHDAAERVEEPSGLNNSRLDGSAAWHDWAGTQIAVTHPTARFFWVVP